jgi:putative phosphoesterase
VSTLRVGVISDTHGLLRPEALSALAGVQHLIHAGDVGAPEVLERLAMLAPVTAVRGNNDHGDWAAQLPEATTFELAGLRLHLLHNLAELAVDPAERGIRVVLAGHSHRPMVRESGEVLYLNPGSAGPRRFRLPVSVALLEIRGETIAARLIELQI